jgi:uncharacterized membrane protein YhhN
MTMSMLIVVSITGAALLTIIGAETARRGLYLTAKPLTMALIIALAWQRDAAAAQAQWLYPALLLSLLGDVLLMFPARAFLAGLLAFLAAHLAYIGLFVSLSGQFWHPIAIALLAAALLYWTRLARYKPRLLPAIVLYTVALLAMCTSAVAVASARGNAPLLIGVGLFAISDGILGWNKFARPLPRAQLWILSSYFAAQTLIVLAL